MEFLGLRIERRCWLQQRADLGEDIFERRPGQSTAVSIPRAAGETPARIVLSNAGGHLDIAEAPATYPPSDSARREEEAAVVDQAIEEIAQ